MRFYTPPIVKNLLIINVVMFLIQMIMPNSIDNMITNYLGLHYFGSQLFAPYQIVTHIFLHANIAHLFSNMFALWMFGRILEDQIGSQRFLIYYSVCGIGAALLHSGVVAWEMWDIKDSVATFLANPTPGMFDALVIDNFPASISDDFLNSWYANPDSQQHINSAVVAARDLLSKSANTVTVGASGAVFGILLAFGYLHPNDRIMLLIPPIPMKAKYFVMGYAVVELMLGLTDNGNIAHFAHLGGMIFGYIMLRYWWGVRYYG